MTTQKNRKSASDRAYKKAREQRYVQARGLCERCGERPAGQTHHVVRRSHRLEHDVSNLRAFCPECHAHVHANVAESKCQGWIATEWPQLP